MKVECPLPEVCSNLTKKKLFADDAKMYKSISNIYDCGILNDSGQRIFEWSEKWCMKLNVDKCKILSVKGRDENKFTYTFSKCNNSFTLEYVDHIMDLGIIIDRDLSFDLRISETLANKAFQML